MMRSSLFLTGVAAIRKGNSVTDTTVAVRDDSEMFTLRVCNAYVGTSAQDIYLIKHGPTERRNNVGVKITDHALAYDECAEIRAHIEPEDHLRFGSHDSSIGHFVVTKDISNADDVMFLVYHRSIESSTTSPTFVSHVFSKVEGAEIAVLNAFHGKESPQVLLRHEHFGDGEEPPYTYLQANQVVEVDPGRYVLKMKYEDHDVQRHVYFGSGENYGVVISGMEDEKNNVNEPPTMLLYSNAAVLSTMFACALAFFNF